MSYLTIPRLVFSGGFQADVSTVNNDVRHYDNASFKPRFQEPMVSNAELNGWYNPDGTGNFRLFDLRITQALSADGADPTQDPATGLFLNAQRERSSCKIVDLDPQMQAVSMLFGLRLVLTDGTNDYLSGNFTPAAFRDIFIVGGPRSALYMSTLTDLEWDADLVQTSPTLMALKAIADVNDNTLAINLTPYNYNTTAMGRNTQVGQMVGSIGTWTKGDPQTFAAVRRLSEATPNTNPPPISEMNADVSGSTLSLDFSNSMALTPGQTAPDLGSIYAAILRTTDTVTGLGGSSPNVKVGVQPGATVTSADIKLLGAVDYSGADFQTLQGAISDSQLDAEASTLVKDHPIAVVQDAGGGNYTVLLRENFGGIYARGDNFVLRMDPPVSGALNETVNFKVTQWGKPLKDVTITTQPVPQATSPRGRNQYWGGGNENQFSPSAPYPYINTSPRAATVSTSFVSGADGWARCGISCTNPGNPRNYVDGQIYTSLYQVAVQNASPQAYLDLIVIHAREAHDYPNPPDWDRDIAPFM